jgi:diphthamide biosynthesis methyltransferase
VQLTLIKWKLPEAARLEAVVTGFGIASKDDYETITKASLVYDAFYTNYKLKIIREKHKAEIEKMDRKQRREFLIRKLMD